MEKVIQLLELEKSTLNDLIKYESADYHDLQMIAEIDQALQLIQSCVVGQSEQLCGFFEASTKTSSATTCIHCGSEKWLHPKAT